MKPELSSAPIDASAQALDMLGPMLAVLAVLFFAAWLFRRFALPGGLRHQALKVVASLPLSTRERVLLVQVGEQQLLVGVSSAGISPLMTLSTPVTAQGNAGEANQSPGFAATLAKFSPLTAATGSTKTNLQQTGDSSSGSDA